MSAIYLSTVSHVHGEPRPITELGARAAELTRPEFGLADYRVSDRETWELAAGVAERTLALSDAAGPPDMLVYVAEGEPLPATAIERIARRIGLGAIAYRAVGGHGCGNLIPALQTAKDALESGRHDRVLLVLADRAAPEDRLMLSGLSVLSDGAAACLVSREPAPGGGGFQVGALTTRSAIAPEPPDAESSLLSMIELAMAGTADLAAATDGGLEGVEHLLFGNYRIISQKFLASAVGLPPERLLLGRVADFGHCFSADPLITLADAAAEGRLTPGDRILVSANGTYSWSMMLVEYTGPGAAPSG